MQIGGNSPSLPHRDVVSVCEVLRGCGDGSTYVRREEALQI